MAFVISKAKSSFPEADQKQVTVKVSEEHGEDNDKSITSKLYLKSSESASSNALNKDVVLRRIRHHKCLSKIKSALEGLVNSSGELDEYMASVHQRRWLDQNDSFCSP